MVRIDEANNVEHAEDAKRRRMEPDSEEHQVKASEQQVTPMDIPPVILGDVEALKWWKATECVPKKYQEQPYDKIGSYVWAQRQLHVLRRSVMILKPEDETLSTNGLGIPDAVLEWVKEPLPWWVKDNDSVCRWWYLNRLPDGDNPHTSVKNAYECSYTGHSDALRSSMTERKSWLYREFTGRDDPSDLTKSLRKELRKRRAPMAIFHWLGIAYGK